ncbi:MAG: hypothetical protein R6V13_10480 [Anaerolineae bacterium]
MSKSIYVTWSEGVQREEIEILKETVEQTLEWLYLRRPIALKNPPLRMRVLGTHLVPTPMPYKARKGTQWYVESSYNDELKRIIAPLFLELVRQAPWQRVDPSYNLALLDQDLTDFPSPLAKLRPDRYSLGTSYPGTTAVMSVYRVRKLNDDHVRRLAIARLVRHHLGHVLGIPRFGREKNVSRLGLEMHCTSPCAMRHAATVNELATYAIEESEMGWTFCERCTRALHSIILDHIYNWS